MLHSFRLGQGYVHYSNPCSLKFLIKTRQFRCIQIILIFATYGSFTRSSRCRPGRLNAEWIPYCEGFSLIVNIALVTTAPIHIYTKATGRVVSVVDTHLDVGDYMVSSEGTIPWYSIIVRLLTLGSQRSTLAKKGFSLRQMFTSCLINTFIGQSGCKLTLRLDEIHIQTLVEGHLQNHSVW
jgi:hypothetical protein